MPVVWSLIESYCVVRTKFSLVPWSKFLRPIRESVMGSEGRTVLAVIIKSLAEIMHEAKVVTTPKRRL